MSKEQFRSNGKLMLTGEYLVLNGAKALSLPTKFGQSLHIEQSTKCEKLEWTSLDVNNQVWFSATYNFDDFSILKSSCSETGRRLARILKAARNLNSRFLNNVSSGCNARSILEFERNWGLGSSSTLLNNIAQWAQVNPFELHFNISNGSGYDIANASIDSPILYSLSRPEPTVQQVHFAPDFAENLFFIHLNKKQISSIEVANFQSDYNTDQTQQATKKVDQITNEILSTKSLAEFERLLLDHEEILESVIQSKPVGESTFPDYNSGICKSLGAWGGDFILVTSKTPDDLQYFKDKGFKTVIPYQQMIL